MRGFWIFVAAIGLSAAVSGVVMHWLGGKDSTGSRAFADHAPGPPEQVRSESDTVTPVELNLVPDSAGKSELVQKDPAGFVATFVHERLKADFGTETCLEVETSLFSLIVGLPENTELAKWAMDRVDGCAKTMPYEQQKAYLERLLEVKPHHVRTLTALGMLEISRGHAHMEVAIERLGEALRAANTPATAYELGLAQLAYAQGLRDSEAKKRAWMFEGAAHSFERAIDLGADDVWIHQAMAAAKLGLGQFDDAVAHAERALASVDQKMLSAEPGVLSDLYFDLGRILFRSGQKETGVAYMDQGIGTAAPGARDELLFKKELILAGAPI